MRLRLGRSGAAGAPPGPAAARYRRDGPALELDRGRNKPLILAGHGVMLGDATKELRAFVDRTGIPVADDAARHRGLPASHPLNLGMMGMHGEAWVNTAIQEADLLIALGMRFDDRVTGNLKTYARNARKIHVDIDAAEINKNVPVDVGIVGDLRTVLRAWLPEVGRPDLVGVAGAHRRAQGRLRRSRHPEPARQRPSLRGARRPRSVADDERRRDRRDGRRPAPDVGGAVLPPRPAASLITSGGLGTMGFALPAAIGAKVGRPDAEVWVVVGDGGFQMTMAELATIAQERLDVKIAIINNGYLGMVRQWQEFFYERRYAATPLLNPDFAKLASAYGIRAETIRTRAAVVPAVKAARRYGAPCCSTSASSRKTPCTRWCRPAPTCTT